MRRQKQRATCILRKSVILVLVPRDGEAFVHHRRGEFCSILKAMSRGRVFPGCLFSTDVLCLRFSLYTLPCARFVRYTLVPPQGSPTPPFLLTRLLASGSSEDVPEDVASEERSDLPFPAMTTDSRHIILVHVAGAETKGDKPGAAAAAATALHGISPRR